MPLNSLCFRPGSELCELWLLSSEISSLVLAYGKSEPVCIVYIISSIVSLHDHSFSLHIAACEIELVAGPTPGILDVSFERGSYETIRECVVDSPRRLVCT